MRFPPKRAAWHAHPSRARRARPGEHAGLAHAGPLPHHPDRGCRHAGQPGAPHRLVLDLPARDAVLPGASAAHRARAHGGLQPGYCRRRLPGHVPEPARLPDILGASQGAAFGAAVAILLGLGSLGISLFAFACSIAAVLLVLAVGTRAKGNHLLIVVLAGVMVSSLFQAGVSFTKPHRRPYRPAGRHHLLAHGQSDRRQMERHGFRAASHRNRSRGAVRLALAHQRAQPWATTKPPPWA